MSPLPWVSLLFISIFVIFLFCTMVFYSTNILPLKIQQESLSKAVYKWEW